MKLILNIFAMVAILCYVSFQCLFVINLRECLFSNRFRVKKKLKIFYILYIL